MSLAVGVITILTLLSVCRRLKAQEKNNEDCSICGFTNDDQGGESTTAESEEEGVKSTTQKKGDSSKDNGVGYQDPNPADDDDDDDDENEDADSSDSSLKADAPELIVKGDIVPPGKYPWVVSLTRTEVGKPVCGGAVISKMWILTAAHCVIRGTDSDGGNLDPQDMTVDLWMKAGSKPTKNLQVSKIIVHPKFVKEGEKKFEHDIALIKLKKPLKCTKNLAPICVPDKQETGDSVDTFTIAGWGETSPTQSETDRKLREGIIKKIEAEKCILKGSGYGSGTSTSPAKAIVCALPSTEDKQVPCHGDSGSTVFSKVEGIYYTLGITSSIKKGQCISKAKETFTKPSYYYKWIKKNVKKLPQPKKSDS